MPKLTFTNLGSLSNETTFLTALNANFTALSTFLDTVVSRDGTSPNTLTANLDVNSKNLNNINNAYVQRLFIGGVEATLGSIQPIAVGEIPVGSEAAPGMVFDGDANTGIWQPSADELSVSVAGTEVFNLDVAGATIYGDLIVTDVDAAAMSAASLATTGNVAVGGTLTVTGAVTFNGAVTIPSGATGTTQAPGTNNTTMATTAFVQAALAALSYLSTSSFTGSNQSLTTDGYQKLPGGLIIQWGTESSTTDSAQTFNFPTAFTTTCFGVVGQRTEANAAYPVGITSWTTSGFTVNRNDSIDGTESIFYIAIGY